MRRDLRTLFSSLAQRFSELNLSFFRARCWSQVVPPPEVIECRCEDGRHWHSGEALTLQMLDCSQDRCERKFETHIGRVAREVHVADLGVTRSLRLYASMVMTTSVCPLRKTVFAKLQTAKYVSFARLGLGAAMQKSQPQPKFGLCRLKPILRLRALEIRTTRRC